jgi:hypothetical protein
MGVILTRSAFLPWGHGFWDRFEVLGRESNMDKRKKKVGNDSTGLAIQGLRNYN